jgi:hypothetical protein
MATSPIKIVPLYPGPAAGVRATPAQLSYRGGPLLGAVSVSTAFWGTVWKRADAPLVTQINDFFGFILTSPLIDQLAEYAVPNQPIGHGTFAGTTTITAPAPRRTVADAAIQSLVQAQIAKATLPTPTANSLYFVYLPPGVSVAQGGQQSCTNFCGYHDSIGGTIYYAVMPYPGCPGCVGGLPVLDALTSTSSHELCEAITDAVPGQGWYDDANGEIGDICAWQTKKVGPWTVQLEWSNQKGACV